jgi:hypothetical protein
MSWIEDHEVLWNLMVWIGVPAVGAAALLGGVVVFVWLFK